MSEQDGRERSGQTQDHGPEWAGVANDFLKLLLTGVTVVILAVHVVAKWNFPNDRLGILVADLALNLAAAGVVSLVVTFFLARYHKAEKTEAQQRLLLAMDQRLMAHLSNVARQLERIDGTDLERKQIGQRFLGVQRVEGSLTTQACADRFKRARKRIDVLNVWVPGLDGLIEPISIALQSGVTVRLIIQHLDSEAIDLRAQALGTRHGATVRREVESNLDLLEDWANREASCESGSLGLKNFQIKYNRTFPPFSMYLVDDEIYVGFYWGQQPAVNGHQIVVSANTTLGEQMIAEFNLIWGRGGPEADVRNWRRSLKVPDGPPSLFPGSFS